MHTRITLILRVRTVFFCILTFIAIGSDINILFAGFQRQTQITDNDGNVWSHPRNLSQSGAAVEPRIVIDMNDMAHVIWREDNAGSFYYTREENGGWLDPIPLELPFATRRYHFDIDEEDPTPLYDPQLFADDNGYIHAFWLGDENGLFFSTVLADEFANFASWTQRQQLEASAVDFAVAVDNKNNIHLSFIRNVDSPEYRAGIYYRKMSDQDLTWSQSVPVYESAYSRNIDQDNAHVEIVAADSTATNTVDITNTIRITNSDAIIDNLGESNLNAVNIWVVGDNRLIEQVYATHSINGGDNWTEPSLVDQRSIEDSEFHMGPSHISVEVIGEEIHLTWLAGHETNCEQYHQWSKDNGSTWESRVSIPFDQQECPDKFELFSTTNGMLFLLDFWEDNTYLSAWNDSEWSELEIQPTLTRFVDPITHREISLGCHQTAVTQNDELIVVGCGTEMFNDIWLVKRPLGDSSTWFPDLDTRTWSLTDSLFQSEVTVNSPTLVTDTEGDLHAFWIEVDTSDLEAVVNNLYHTRWDGTVWSRPIPVIDLQTATADQLAVVLLPNNHFFVTWYDSETNTYFQRQVESENVRIPSNWSAIQPLNIPHELINTPSFFVSSNDILYLTYAVPINEGRGIYEMHSENSGVSWTEPALVVDAITNKWQMVNQPYMIQTADGQLHALWTVNLMYSDPTTTALYYAHSSDERNQWQNPVLVSEGMINWSRLADIGEKSIVIVWQQASANGLELLSQQSLDGGVTWERPFILHKLGEPVSLPVLTADNASQLHLVQLFENHEGALFIQEWLKSNENWRIGNREKLDLNLTQISITDIASATVHDSQFFTLFASERVATDETNQDALGNIYYTHQDLDLPPIIPSVSPVGVVTIAPFSLPATAVSSSEEEIERKGSEHTETITPTLEPLANSDYSQGVFRSASSLLQVGIGILPVALIVLAIFVWRLYRPSRLLK